MSEVSRRRGMTSDEFVAWAMARPEGEPRVELEAGELVAMAPERLGHAETKGRAPGARGRDPRRGAALPGAAGRDGGRD